MSDNSGLARPGHQSLHGYGQQHVIAVNLYRSLFVRGAWVALTRDLAALVKGQTDLVTDECYFRPAYLGADSHAARPRALLVGFQFPGGSQRNFLLRYDLATIAEYVRRDGETQLQHAADQSTGRWAAIAGPDEDWFAFSVLPYLMDRPTCTAGDHVWGDDGECSTCCEPAKPWPIPRFLPALDS